MRTRTILSTAISFFFAIESSAQTAITSLYNGYRDGDKLYRIVVDETSLGDRGENCVWDLPPVQKDASFLRQVIYLRNDSLTIVEGDLMLHYIATDEKLSLRGFQRRDMFCVQDSLSLELKYPFAYGDSIADSYKRRTTYYDRFSIESEGSCYTVCDGKGVLTDGSETLKDVLRVHHHNTIISRYNETDGDNEEPVVSEVTEDKYVWYYPGSRYPVMATRVIKTKTDGEVVSDTIFTSLYMPELQISELPYDDANNQVIAQREANGQGSGKGDNGNQGDKPFPITMSASLQPGHTTINLDYFVTEDTDVTFFACDLAGRVLGSVSHISLSEGEYHETMVLNNRPINNVVMLTMIVGDTRKVVKVS